MNWPIYQQNCDLGIWTFVKLNAVTFGVISSHFGASSRTAFGARLNNTKKKKKKKPLTSICQHG